MMIGAIETLYTSEGRYCFTNERYWSAVEFSFGLLIRRNRISITEFETPPFESVRCLNLRVSDSIHE